MNAQRLLKRVDALVPATAAVPVVADELDADAIRAMVLQSEYLELHGHLPEGQTLLSYGGLTAEDLYHSRVLLAAGQVGVR